MKSNAILFSILTAFALVSCAPARMNTNKSITDLRQAEINFSNASVQNGMGRAFVDFADTNVVKLNDGMFPIVGKEQLNKLYGKDKSHFPFTLQWVPEKVEVAASGDLGYTYGNWEMKTKTQGGKDTSYYGNYVTVWKKQSDGKWKFVIDGGNNTPKPENKPVANN